MRKNYRKKRLSSVNGRAQKRNSLRRDPEKRGQGKNPGGEKKKVTLKPDEGGREE